MAQRGTIAITDFDWYTFLSQRRSWAENGCASREIGPNLIFATRSTI